jgi:hypothetical protein
MPGGQHDSSKTRVVPVFDRLAGRRDDWVRALLSLADYGSGAGVPPDLDLTFVRGHWGVNERGLAPPVSLLSWLIRNLMPPVGPTSVTEERTRLLNRDPKTIEQALELLKSKNADRGWWVFEGPTYPDALIETPAALVVVEGKRTESSPTTHTTWMPNRHQIWRHMDAAWEIRGNRAVFGIFVVSAELGTSAVPAIWQAAASATLSRDAIAGSFPHRGPEEREAIAQGFFGLTTWQKVCAGFGIDHDSLPDTVAGAVP